MDKIYIDNYLTNIPPFSNILVYMSNYNNKDTSFYIFISALNKVVNEHVNYQAIAKALSSFYNVSDKFCEQTKKQIQESYKKALIPLVEALKATDNTKEKIGDIKKQTIEQISSSNSGYVTNEIIKPLNISRQYISDLVKEKKIEKLDKGIYANKNTIPDEFYIFQQRYSKAIYSHMNALYFYHLTEEIPYKKTVTIKKNYHNEKLKKECKVHITKDTNYEIGLTAIETPYGNIVKTYDKERCICDIIKDQNKLDFEQVKKSVIMYVNSKDCNLNKLTMYAKQMGIEKKVIGFVRMYV